MANQPTPKDAGIRVLEHALPRHRRSGGRWLPTDRVNSGPPGAGVLLLGIVLMSANAFAQVPAPTVLPPLTGDAHSVAFDINDAGQVAGSSADVTSFPFVVNPVTWDKDGLPTALTLPIACSPAPFPYSAYGVANFINNRGEIAGYCLTSAGPPLALRWDSAGNPMVLSPLAGDTSSDSFGINDLGEVAGYSRSALTLTAVVWDDLGFPTALPPLPGDLMAVARGINNSGLIVGVSGLPPLTPIETAVIWDRNGQPAELPPPPGDMSSLATAINDSGEVVGISFSSLAGPFTPVKWDRSGIPTALTVEVAGYPYAINNRGAVSGWEGQQSSLSMATYWDAAGTPKVLPALAGAERSLAVGMNSRNEMVGFSLSPSFVRTALKWKVQRKD